MKLDYYKCPGGKIRLSNKNAPGIMFKCLRINSLGPIYEAEERYKTLIIY
jgi:hypothetical protein